MENILGWLGNIPWGTVIAAGLTFIVGFLAKQAMYAKVLDTLVDLADLVSDYSKAQADGKVDSDEAKELLADIKHIVSDYAAKAK